MNASLTEDFFHLIDKKPIFDSKEIESFVVNHPNFLEFQKRINYNFKNKSLLFNAIVQSSFSHEFGEGKVKNNEVLEFLGDSILGAVVAIKISERFNALNEGQLSKIKSALVSEEPLSEIAESIGVSKVLLVGRGEFKNGGHLRASNTSSAVEAITAAIYLDSGFSAAETFILNAIKTFDSCHDAPFINGDRIDNFDAKSKLQEMTMKMFKEIPKYLSVQNDDQSFTVELIIRGKSIAKITNISKKRAELSLARTGLQYLKNDKLK